MAHRRSRVKKIEAVRWTRNHFFFGAQAAGSVALNFITSADAIDTVLRIRGEVTSWIDGNDAPPVGVDCALGLLVMPEGQGTTVLSSPITDENAPWLLYERWTLAYEEIVTDVIAAQGVLSFRKTIDNKAMRILRPDREVQIVFEQATVSGAGSVNCGFAASVLLGQA